MSSTGKHLQIYGDRSRKGLPVPLVKRTYLFVIQDPSANELLAK